jgi:hypothetical protein
LVDGKFFHVKHRLDRATFFAAADERAVGAFAEDEVQRADDDGFARAGLAGDDIATRLEFQRQVAYQGKVFDAQRRQHLRTILTTDAADEHGEINFKSAVPKPV